MDGTDVFDWLKIAIAGIISFILINAFLSINHEAVKCVCNCAKELNNTIRLN